MIRLDDLPWQPLATFSTEIVRAIIWRFLRNGDVMRMTLPYTRRRNLDKSRFASELFDRMCAAVSHPRSHTADELVNECTEGTFERNAAFDSLGN